VNYILLAINYALMILIPIGVAVYIHRRTKASWRLFFIGAVTFILSQVFHIPFNWLVEQTGVLPDSLETTANLLIVAGFLGLSAGVFEETARYLMYRFWAKDARSWSRGLMLGAGHGGIEAILLGALAAVGIIGLVMTANNEAVMSTIPADQQALITESLAGILDQPWYALLLGAVERVFAIAAHLALSILVLQVFLRGSIRWLFLAIGYHALFNMIAVVAVSRVGPYATEGLLGLFSLMSLLIIFKFRTPEPEPVEPEPLPEVITPALQPTDEAIERSRFN
jgi:uncharacterized membrane protein YhfC